MPKRAPRPPRPPRWQRRPGARPEEILRAALEVFGDAGYGRARLEDVARRAGVSKATLYLYFPSKAELFGAMIRSQARVTPEPPLTAASFFPDSAAKKLERFLRESWAALQRPELRRLLRLVYAERARFPELGHFYLVEVILPLRERLERVLAAGRARGEFRATPHDFALQALPSLLLHQAMLRDGLSEHDPAHLEDPQLVAAMLDWSLEGLRRRASRSSAE
ncbi:MAG TPA: TetR/AcrR family transcriptional regulator [Gemmatimonadales bacterium]|nr:TetR/AcrR family transcriptional regulator [Gemmatimonadales bacterium]